MLRSEATVPRLTCYDDAPGPTNGERIELSAKVLANWVAKAANLLQDEFDVSTDTSVLLDLPAHWRTAYWALAIWSVGATVVLPHGAGPDPEATVTITDDPALAAVADPVVLVTLAALARCSPGPVPTGALDEARELATFPDAFAPWDTPAPQDPALVCGGERTAYADLVAPHDGPARAHVVDPDTATFLRATLAVWAADGSIVLTRGRPPADVLDRRRSLERVTLDLDA